MRYTNPRPIHTGLKTVISRCERVSDGATVIVKEWRERDPSEERVMRMLREFEVLRRAACPEVVEAIEFSVEGGVVRLVMEDFGGVSLKQLYREQRPDLRQALKIALGAARALETVHAAGIVHKDVTPGNVVVHPTTGRVKLIDFGISSVVRREDATPHQTTFQGTPAYMSPEQTGRMNRSIDHRSDLYTLGATLYQLLTGAPPFPGGDRRALIRAHVATLPRRVGGVPEVVADIVAILLSKRAEDRYQSASGLAWDLERCIELLDASGEIAPFSLRSRDLLHTLIIPQHLYGRSREVSALERAFSAVVGGAARMALVAGYSGIGKTALVREMERIIAPRDGAAFIEGKVDRFNRTPYGSLMRAFRGFLRRALADETQRDYWRTQVQRAVGAAGAALVEVMPEVERLIGAQPPLDEVSAAEAENRFRVVLHRFVQAMAGPLHPVVLFVDDLQWAEPGTLQLLEGLLEDPETSHLLILGAYRDNELEATHPLKKVASAPPQWVDVLTLGPLDASDVRALVADALHRPPGEVGSLAALLTEKTGGNPFFLRRFLQEVAEDGLLQVASHVGRWVWDEAAIAGYGATANVVEFMTESLARIPAETRGALEAAACVGGTFSLSLVAAALGRTRHATQALLQPALEQGLVLPLGEGYWFGGEEARGDAQVPDATLRFAHDRIEEAARAAVSPERHRGLSLTLGRRLLARRPGAASEARATWAFEVAAHMNRALPLIEDDEERAMVREVNREAGLQAMKSAAWPAAHAHLQAAVALSPASWWAEAHEGAVALHLSAARVAYLAGDREAMEACSEEVLQRGALLERAQAKTIRVEALIARGAHREGVLLALDTLDELGEPLPRDPTEADVGQGLQETLADLDAHPVEVIVTMPELTDPQVAAARRLMSRIISAAYLSTPNLMTLLAFRLVRSSLRSGLSRESSHGLVLLALVLCALRMFDRGYTLGQLAERLLGRWQGRAFNAQVGHIWNTHVRVFKDPLAVSAAQLEEVFQLGVNTGDLEYAGWAGHNHCCFALYSGLHLGQAATAFASYRAALERYGQAAPLACHLPFEQLVRNLRGQAEDPARLIGPEYDEEEAWSLLEARGYRGPLFLLCVCQLMARTMAGAYEDAVAIGARGEPFQDGAAATVHVATFYFYDALANLARVQTAAREPTAMRRLERALASLEHVKAFAEAAPVNHGHRLALLEAELCRIHGRVGDALERYDAAIEQATQHNAPLERALAQERAGRFFLGMGRVTVARLYLTTAATSWEEIGAAARSQALILEFTSLLRASPFQTTGSLTSTVTETHLGHETITGTVDARDLAPAEQASGSETVTSASTVTSERPRFAQEGLLEASWALSAEIHTGPLLKRVARVFLEQTGATRAAVCLKERGVLTLKALCDARGRVELIAAPLNQQQEIPEAVMEHVEHTREELLLFNLHEDARFAHAARSREPLSVLALPIAHEGRAWGSIYLENTLSAGAFTLESAQVAALLATQAALSLANATLYQNTHDMARSLSRFVPWELVRALGHSQAQQLSPGDAATMDAAVLVIGVHGLDEVTPAQRVHLMDRACSRVGLAVARHGGFIHGVARDVITALFLDGPDGALLALDGARDSLRDAAQDPPLTLSAGLHQGALTLGALQAQGRVSVTVQGEVPARAEALERAARGRGVTALVTREIAAVADPGRLRACQVEGRDAFELLPVA